MALSAHTALSMVFCDAEGRLYDHPELGMVGASGTAWRPARLRETIPLPDGAAIVSMPGRHAVGWDPAAGQFEAVDAVPDIGGVCAAAAVLPPAYLRTLLPAQVRPDGAPPLPLLGYAAVGWADEKFRVAAFRLDRRRRWDPEHYDTADLGTLINETLAALPDNRIVAQLARCSAEYHCYTAQNLFYGRWEAGVPVSPVCNARCVGCISLQPAECCPSPQERIAFEPTVEEIEAVLVHHLATARDAIASFGQGCEGEPLLRADLIAEAVARARRRTRRGTVNINTNGSRPEVIDALADAGIDSLRVSLASADPARYDAYHRPVGYGLGDVEATVARARARGLWVAANVLAFPGITDAEDEARALIDFVRRHDIHAVQMRNLNLDPDELPVAFRPAGEAMGVRDLVRALRRELPGVSIDSFNRPMGS